MRLVCEYGATLPAATGGRALAITFTDNSFSERIGWREIVFDGDLAGVSQRLTSYPQDLLTQPLDVRSVDYSVPSAGGTVAGVDRARRAAARQAAPAATRPPLRRRRPRCPAASALNWPASSMPRT